MTFSQNIGPKNHWTKLKRSSWFTNLIEIQTDSFKDFLDHGFWKSSEDVLPRQALPTHHGIWNLSAAKSVDLNPTLEEVLSHGTLATQHNLCDLPLDQQEAEWIRTQEVFFLVISSHVWDETYVWPSVGSYQHPSWLRSQGFTSTIRLTKAVKLATAQQIVLAELSWS